MIPPKLSDAVFYWPSSHAPQGPLGKMAVKDSGKAMKATVAHVHNDRLVDLVVDDHAKASHTVRFVPFLHDGDPDPRSPTGRCQSALKRQGPQPVVANPGTEHEFVINPGDVGDAGALVGLK